jgi:hypothetical protein
MEKNAGSKISDITKMNLWIGQMVYGHLMKKVKNA